MPCSGYGTSSGTKECARARGGKGGMIFVRIIKYKLLHFEIRNYDGRCEEPSLRSFLY